MFIARSGTEGGLVFRPPGRLFQCGINTSAENIAQPAKTMNTVTVFIVFAGCAIFSALVLIPHWNSRPGGLKTNPPSVPDRAMNMKPLRT